MIHAHDLQDRLRALDTLLVDLQWLWRPMPYKEGTPSWVARAPHIAEALMALGRSECTHLTQDASAALTWLGQFEARCHDLNALCLSQAVQRANTSSATPLQWEVPGRKWQQVHTFCDAMEKIEHPILDWCGGKGHLGRYAAQRWQQPVTTLEINPALCQEGERLARRAGGDQRFHAIDVLSPASESFLPNRHVLALHACGDLHRELVRKAAKSGVAAMSIAPCCYHLGKEENYQPFNLGLQLRLSREDRRIAVTESATASPRGLALRDKETAWKLAFDEWQQDVYKHGYRPIKPVPKVWLRLTFATFIHHLAQREGLLVPSDVDYAHYAQRGRQRFEVFQRFNIVRLAFRRAIEHWLVFDMAVFLRREGYSVSVSAFCLPGITPRNLLISVVTA